MLLSCLRYFIIEALVRNCEHIYNEAQWAKKTEWDEKTLMVGRLGPRSVVELLEELIADIYLHYVFNNN